MRCSVVDDYQAAPRREGVLPEEGFQLTGHDVEHLAAAPDVGMLCFGGGVDEVVHGKALAREATQGIGNGGLLMMGLSGRASAVTTCPPFSRNSLSRRSVFSRNAMCGGRITFR